MVSKKEMIHPSEKPVSVLEKIVAAHTNEGEIVLDCFMGSGSTGQAAINLNRKFIGIEPELKYFNEVSNILLNKRTSIS